MVNAGLPEIYCHGGVDSSPGVFCLRVSVRAERAKYLRNIIPQTGSVVALGRPTALRSRGLLTLLKATLAIMRLHQPLASVAPLVDEDPLEVEIAPCTSRDGGETVTGEDFRAGVIHDSLDCGSDSTGIHNACNNSFRRTSVINKLSGLKIVSFNFRGLFLSRSVGFRKQKKKWDY